MRPPRLTLAVASIILCAAMPAGAQDTLTIKNLTTRVKADMDSIESRSRLNGAQVDKNNRAEARARARQDSILIAMRGAAPTPPTPGTEISPGSSIQAAVNAAAAGTTFILKAGTHLGQRVVPKAGDVFIGEGAPGATKMDGQDTTLYAFYGYNGSAWVNNVTVRNIEIKKYDPPAQRGAINMSGDDTSSQSSGWTLDSVYVHHNAGIGIRVGNRARILRSRSDSNSTMGIGGIGRAVWVENFSSRFNNPGCVNDPGFESGGSKFVYTDSLVVRFSTFSDNCGVGLWEDIWNRNSVLEYNTVERNYREGICIEVSGPRHVIRHNIVNANGWPTDPFRANGWAWDAGIGIHATPEVEVYGNTVNENFNGIVILQQKRDVAAGDSYAPVGGFVARNNLIRDNIIYQRTFPSNHDGGWGGGAVQDNQTLPTSVFTQNNQWTRNTYYTRSSSSTGNAYPFAWANGARSPSQWRGYGQDLNGTFNE